MFYVKLKVWESWQEEEMHIVEYLLLYFFFCSAISVPAQTAPPPRMVNLCQTTQTTLIAPNPMLQSAILMQQMQGAAWINLCNSVSWNKESVGYLKYNNLQVAFSVEV